MGISEIKAAGHLTREDVLPLLQALPGWGPLTTIVFSHGCVFEFKGAFPRGEAAGGYYNLLGPVPGFHGHLRLDTLAAVGFQDRPHRGRESLALVFVTAEGETVFKVFLGRDASGEIFRAQRQHFEQLRNAASASDATAEAKNHPTSEETGS